MTHARAPASRARTIALHVLSEVERGEFSNRALTRALERERAIEGRERGFATTLVYGVLRHRARLDRLIDTFAHRPDKLRGRVRDILRIASLELRELGHEPYVATSQAVAMARRFAPNGALTPVMHAILQGIAREGEGIDAALAADDVPTALVHRWSIPAWLADRWYRRLGAERALARARALSHPPPLDLRIDTHRCNIEDTVARLQADYPAATIERVDDEPQAVRMTGAGDVFYGPLHDAGLVSVQSLASQKVVRALAPEPGMRVLDACAGLGVKTVHLAEHMQRRGTIVACDIEGRRLQQLQLAAARCDLRVEGLELAVYEGDCSNEVVGLDAQAFDAILVDAPCSGLGNLAKHPEIRWQRSEADVMQHTHVQRALLDRCVARLRRGGRLVYAVCSLEDEEGRNLVDDVAVGPASLVRQFDVTPEDHRTDGFHVALLRSV